MKAQQLNIVEMPRFFKLSSSNRIPVTISNFIAIIGLILVAQWSNAQSDPGVGSIAILDLDNNPVAASQLKKNGTYKLRLQVGNYSTNILHAGCAEVRVGLGSLFELEENFDLSTAPLSNLYDWTIFTGFGQVEIVGELLVDIGNVLGNAEFEITAIDDVGNSTFNTSFKLNGGGGCTDSETNLSNNIANLQYGVQNPWPSPARMRQFTSMKMVWRLSTKMM
ncbi:MAG: hypothetical protein IPL46_21295 [Saprospiraceae bacterium]|nr:hypothetical protein [Saprospiraceae bacterium]